MIEKQLLLDRQSWSRFISSLKLFAISKQEGTKAIWLFTGLIAFMFGLNGLNVVNSYVGRDFITSIENRNLTEFMKQAMLYVGVFAGTTIVSVFFRYTEETLGLLWREWSTKRCIIGYASHRVYYRLKQKKGVENPDQRIADDIRTYTAGTLSFMLMLLNGTFTVIAFSGVLWSISPLLFVVSVAYAAVGTMLTFILGRPLVRLNYDQLDTEANFRASLTYLRGNADSVALSRREGGLIQLSLNKLAELLSNFRRIIKTNRNVNFFTNGYNWMIQIIPALLIAPLFIEGKVQFGVITQSAMAFSQLIGAFSLIITQFQSISSYTAVAARLVSLVERSVQEKDEDMSNPVFLKNEGLVAYSGLTLHSPRSNRMVIENLNLEIPRGRNVLVQGPDETARAALFHATVGLWAVSQGHITRPWLEHILMLPERPYLPPGTLRELLMRPWPEDEYRYERKLGECQVSDESILQTLTELKLESLITIYGFDKRHHWENDLPLAEQKLLVIARALLAKPAFVFLDRPGTTLSPAQLDWVLDLFRQHAISCVTFEERGGSLDRYDALLDLEEGGAWKYRPVWNGRIVDGV